MGEMTVDITAVKRPETSSDNIYIENVSHGYRGRHGTVIALEDIDLVFQAGEFTCIVGPSGCGKSTLLDLVAGLQRPLSGTIRHGGRIIDGPNEACAMVFQQPALFPWMSVLENVVIGPVAHGVSRRDAEERARLLLSKVGLSKVTGAFPHELSGGMAQRVGIVRALALDPAVLLMDEPFAAVDAQTRIRLQDEVKALVEESRTTVVFVTHDVGEAVYLGTSVIVMSGGPGRVISCRPMEEASNDKRSSYFVETAAEIMDMLLGPGA